LNHVADEETKKKRKKKKEDGMKEFVGDVG
jgi:hypothetical protein